MPSRLAISLSGTLSRRCQRLIIPSNATSITPFPYSFRRVGLCAKRGSIFDANYAAKWVSFRCKSTPKRSKVQKVQHHPALPHAELPEFLQSLRALGGTAPLALEFLILTATRTSETLNVVWDEIDMDKQVWVIPAARMKAEKEHRIPLSKQAMKILKIQMEDAGGDFVFPGRNENCPMSNMALLQLLKRLERTDITVHGFRSSFRDWVGETTHYPREVAEAALAHGIKDKAEAAYARGDLFTKRAKMMQEWADYVVENNRK